MEFCDANIDKLYWLIKNVDSCARGLNTYILWGRNYRLML